MTLTLTTDRLTLRRPDARDVEGVVQFYTSKRAQFVGGPMAAATAWRQIAAEIGHWDIRGYGLWAITHTQTGDTLGLAGPWNPLGWPEKEIAWFLLDGAQGNGYATEAARATINDAYNRLKWDTAVSYIAPANIASAKVAQTLGAVIDPNAPQVYPDMAVDVYRHPNPMGMTQ